MVVYAVHCPLEHAQPPQQFLLIDSCGTGVFFLPPTEAHRNGKKTCLSSQWQGQPSIDKHCSLSYVMPATAVQTLAFIL